MLTSESSKENLLRKGPSPARAIILPNEASLARTEAETRRHSGSRGKIRGEKEKFAVVKTTRQQAPTQHRRDELAGTVLLCRSAVTGQKRGGNLLKMELIANSSGAYNNQRAKVRMKGT